MTETDDILEEKKHGLEINAAVLHILDGVRKQITLSERTMDLEDPLTFKFVRKYVSRCQNDMRARPAVFAKESQFRSEMERYFRGEASFPQFTGMVCEGLSSYLQNEEARSVYVLFADCRDDDVPYIAMVMLEEQDTVVPFVKSEQGMIENALSFHQTALPASSRPAAASALINMLSGEIMFTDDAKWKDGGKIIQDRLLEAQSGMSRREVIEHVKAIADETARELQENPAVVLSKVKNYISEAAEEGMPLKPDTMVSEIFEDAPQMADLFMKKAEEITLPKETELPKKAVSTSMKKQRIATDTGIEISFPAEYAEGGEFIEFTARNDGTITIEIRSVRQITNRN